MPKPFRILLIEDDPVRIEQFQAWMPNDVILVVASSPGRVIGTLRRDGHGVYAGILLDHDLQLQAAVAEEISLSGSNLVPLIIQKLDNDTPVFIHSLNERQAPRMVEALENAGFWVTRVRMYQITETLLVDWIEDVRSLWFDE